MSSQLPDSAPESPNPFSAPSATGPSGSGYDPFSSGAPEITGKDRKKLNGCRWAMIIVGLLTIGLNAYLFLNAPSEVDSVVAKEARNGVAIDEGALLQIVRVIYGGSILLGCVLTGLGALVMRFPLFSTLVGLMIYLGSIALFGFLSPDTLIRGIFFKIVIVVVLVQGVITAINLKTRVA